MARYLLALDIDGTCTDSSKLPQELVDYLAKLSKEGAVICFVTGRFFPYAKAPLEALPFPFYLATQNGAELYQNLLDKPLKSYYLSKDLILEIDYRCKDVLSDFIVYSSKEHGYKTFYRESKFDKSLLGHILSLESAAFHPYQKLESFIELPFRACPCMKFLGLRHELEAAEQAIKGLPVSQTLIKDPTSFSYYMNLVTHEKATKGHVVSHLKSLIQDDLKVIAAGNDINDVSLLQSADIGICVGAQAPELLLKQASLVAREPGCGLINSLETAKQILGV
jgi:HAD superfamily hydrolase (TIGR01484 family)